MCCKCFDLLGRYSTKPLLKIAMNPILYTYVQDLVTIEVNIHNYQSSPLNCQGLPLLIAITVYQRDFSSSPSSLITRDFPSWSGPPLPILIIRDSLLLIDLDPQEGLASDEDLLCAMP